MHMSTKLKSKLEERIDIPNEIEVSIEGTLLRVKGSKGSQERRFVDPNVKMTKQDNLIVLETKGDSRKDKRILNTFRAHVTNMITGVKDGFKYKLKICSGHFPISAVVKGKVVEISNFLGEKIPRKARIMEGVSVKVDGEFVIVEGADIERAGNTASRIEQATRITDRDRRVFQDGVFIIEKPGVRHE